MNSKLPAFFLSLVVIGNGFSSYNLLAQTQRGFSEEEKEKARQYLELSRPTDSGKSSQLSSEARFVPPLIKKAAVGYFKFGVPLLAYRNICKAATDAPPEVVISSYIKIMQADCERNPILVLTGGRKVAVVRDVLRYSDALRLCTFGVVGTSYDEYTPAQLASAFDELSPACRDKWLNQAPRTKMGRDFIEALEEVHGVGLADIEGVVAYIRAERERAKQPKLTEEEREELQKRIDALHKKYGNSGSFKKE